ncbi:hypothetical protein Nepgr_030898 [Nepenthes gracilis]|uniref:Uncharacterized protein n=1 Tax=Nepenthes gracilis TaxID=150966 RepID=A0AAD3Y690_NEPGR|nr:hypothetical protein Nepgr_030898 [Nepenthes gracilis]
MQRSGGASIRGRPIQRPAKQREGTQDSSQSTSIGQTSLSRRATNFRISESVEDIQDAIGYISSAYLGQAQRKIEFHRSSSLQSSKCKQCCFASASALNKTRDRDSHQRKSIQQGGSSYIISNTSHRLTSQNQAAKEADERASAHSHIHPHSTPPKKKPKISMR